ncbi:MAG: PH domain-containing protein [Actinomycetota bacterium]|nr:PH domain-containing protein [Actinomycetota bacterium]
MPYPKKLLNDYETVAVDLHPHWWYFAQPVAALVGSIILGIIALVSDVSGTFVDILKWLMIVLIIISAIWVVVRYLKWMTTNFVITSDRLIFRAGVLAKMGVEIPLERVNTVHFSQSIFERMTGSGDLLIESGGEDGQQLFSDIRHPDRVQNLIHSQMEENEKRRFTGNSATDVASQLEKLEGMLDRGTLTPEEFRSQKDKLLGS